MLYRSSITVSSPAQEEKSARNFCTVRLSLYTTGRKALKKSPATEKMLLLPAVDVLKNPDLTAEPSLVIHTVSIFQRRE